MTLRTVSLDDKYTQQEGRIFITGTQALVRLPLMQHLRDKAEGFHTGGYISGYRGSPLGGYDQQLWAAKKHLQAHHIVFNPGVNEDLAATACWGSQQWFQARPTTPACSPSGMARVRAWIARVTRFATATWRALIPRAACWP
jgi:indolepyruvate ferredoxin oxidoreductase